jgi:hypothetical protein
MRADQRSPLARVAVLLAVVLCCFGTSVSTGPVAIAADAPKYHLDYGPSDGKACPPDFTDTCGIDKHGNYCDYYAINDDSACRMPEAGEMPGTIGECENLDGSASSACSDQEVRAVEKKKLEKWRQTGLAAVQRGDLTKADYDKFNGFLTKCIDDGGFFTDCQTKAANKFGTPGDSLADWVGKKISQLARDALEEAAQYIGNAVVWLLQQFADIFNKTSVINLNSTGIGQPMGIATALSAVIAVFLLLMQFGKVAVSHQGGPAATAISGLAKWAVISSAYLTVTTTALQISDSISTWIINYSFNGGGGNAADTMKAQFGKMFGGLIAGGGGASAAGGALITGQGVAPSAVAVVIIIGIVCILAIGALWIEMLLRQAGIMILVATMPIVLVGQMSDATKDWWPKARDALLALILMKPMIVFCFAIGFFAIDQGQGVQNMIVGLVIFLLACFAWPTLAKFMTFSTLGAGASMASGLFSSLGSSASSIHGGYRPGLFGAGSVGGGPAYTRALERDNAQTQSSGSNAKGYGGRFATRVAGPLGLGLQALAVGKDVLETGMANTAAHAGLDSASHGGRHVIIPPRYPNTARPPADPGTPREMPQRPPTATRPDNPGVPPQREG